MTAASDLLTTPLNALHIELGARMVPLAGYSMPVQYPAGLVAEHHHTRNAAGLFDVSHMGEFVVKGERATEFLQHIVSNDVSALFDGKVQYAYLGVLQRPFLSLTTLLLLGGGVFI